MPPHPGPILLDTMVFIECWRVGGWKALAGRYRLETVETCEAELLTGFQTRPPEQQIPPGAVREACTIHPVDDRQRAEASLREPQLGVLDAGEQDLWAHAFGRADDWILSGPDKASLRVAVRQGFRDRLVSLEQLLGDVGFSPSRLRENHKRDWLEKTLSRFAFEEGVI
jgi:hypothetical protein